MDISMSAAETFECTLCGEIPRGNIYQCFSGHHMCDLCSTKVTHCTICGSTEVRIRNQFAERVLDAIEFPCRWSDHGCEMRMRRSQLTAHEDLCDLNPNMVNFCGMFCGSTTAKCQFKITPKWLSEPENCTEFMSHVQSCLGLESYEFIEFGERKRVQVADMMSTSTSIPFSDTSSSEPEQELFKIAFFRLNSLNDGQVELFLLTPMLKIGSLGEKSIGFALVQLTPETTPLYQVKLSIDGMPNSELVSTWGQNSLPSQNWTQSVIGLKTLEQFIEQFSSTSLERGGGNLLPLPISFPRSFLSEYYAGEV